MSRRKQSHPRHLNEPSPTLLSTNNHLNEVSTNKLTDEILKTGPAQNGSSEIENNQEVHAHVCGKCREEFLSLEQFLLHKPDCKKGALPIDEYTREPIESDRESDSGSIVDSLENNAMNNEDNMMNIDDERYRVLGAPINYNQSALVQNNEMLDQSDDDDDVDSHRSSSPVLMSDMDKQESIDLSMGESRKLEDKPLSAQQTNSLAGFNDSNDEDASDSSMSASSDEEGKQEENTDHPTPTTDLPQLDSKQQLLPDTNVILESLQNTKVAVAQFPYGYSNPKDFIALQSALMTLQQQQVMQLQLIQQLQSQLLANGGTGLPFPPPGFPFPGLNFNGPPIVSTTVAPPTVNVSEPVTPPKTTSENSASVSSVTVTSPSPIISSTHLPTQTTSSSTSSSSAIMSSMPYPENPSSPDLNQPNCLELLQRHTQQTLESAQSSMLSNGLNPLSYRKGKPPNVSSEDQKSGSREEPFFRHRCRYCGKVFGSDSALQIHIRSHTGERPYKCNICGNRFTTKGNLKVHFQRHKQKYPHIRMNPNPVPEHLDKLHPALYPGAGNSPPPLPPILTPMTNNFTPTSFTPTSFMPPSQSFMQHHESPLLPHHHRIIPPQQQQPLSLVNIVQKKDNESNIKEENFDDRPPPALQRLQPLPNDDFNDDERRSIDDKPPFLDEMVSHNSVSDDDEDDDDMDIDMEMNPDRFENFISHSANERFNTRSHSPRHFHSDDEDPIPRPSSLPMSLTNYHHERIDTNEKSFDDSFTSPPNMPRRDLMEVPNPLFVNHLLPRPGSNDNAWESLMEVTKPSETTKLQQLVDNIEHKLSDPNQCIICHRVLSCKSALQMHYRTHTGERPFKCKLCGRAFTTKGNLKTHMGVHRVKPPMSVLHQCPVCHKRFTNSIVLQQHIKIHTGEPTDLTPDQIRAAEIRDFSIQFNPSNAIPVLPTLPANLPVPKSAPSFMSTPMQLPLLSSMNHRPVDPIITANNNNGDNLDSFTEEKDNLMLKPNIKREDDEKSVSGHSSDNCSDEEKWDTPSDSLVKPPIPDQRSPVSFATSLAMLESQVKGINSSVAQAMPFGLLGYGVDPSNLMHLTNGNMRRHHFSDNISERSVSDTGRSPSPNNNKHLSESSSNEDRISPMSNKSEHNSISRSHGGSPQYRRSISSPEDNINSSGALDLTPRTSSSVQQSLIPPLSSPMFLPPFGSQLNSLPLPPTFPGHFPTTCNICFKTFACSSALDIHYRSHTKERPYKCHACDRGFSTKGNMKQHMLTHKIRDLPSNMFSQNDSSDNSSDEQPEEKTSPTEILENNNIILPSTPVKRPVEECGPIPIPKRPVGFPKHMCHVCNKNFSSASALQIHMRTHTGDKPFKCSVCDRAFTTKGNLKVHMGTHMWNNGASRRGRRISMESPQIGLSQKENEFNPTHKPEMFFPYLPSPYLNGLGPKLGNIASLANSMSLPNSFGLPQPTSLMNSMPTITSLSSSMLSTAVSGGPPLPIVTSSFVPNAVEADLRKSSSSHAGIISPISSSRDQQLDLSKGSPWMWKMTCTVCHVACSNPIEFENHMKSHFRNDNKDSKETNNRGENVAA